MENNNEFEVYGKNIIDRFVQFDREKQYYAFVAVVLSFVNTDRIDEYNKVRIFNFIDNAVNHTDLLGEDMLYLYCNCEQHKGN